jgi:aminoglycoside 3-N-acetyltransferase
LHPTHSIAAIGAASVYASGHERVKTPCDEGSPYYRLIARKGWILLLGATQESNTTLHCLEELANVPYHLQDDVTAGLVIDNAGTRHVVRNRLHRWKWKRDFPKIDRPLTERGVLRIGMVGLAEARLVRADRLAEVVLPLLRTDPLYLLADDACAAW